MSGYEGEGIRRYWAAIQALQAQVLDHQFDVLSQVAGLMAETIAGDKRIFLFGSGHSHMLAEEGHYRAGGLAPVVPILLSSLMLHESAIFSGLLERTPGLTGALLARYQPQAGEMLFIFSNSGVNQLPVEMALKAKQVGLTVVSVSSRAYAKSAPLSALGQRLDEVADYAIDNGGPSGDSLVRFDGLPWAVGPSSTVIGSLIWNALVTETGRRLHDSSQAVPVFASANMPGAVEHNQKLLAKWRKLNPHL